MVSVVVPVLNMRHRIRPCLEALLDQTYPRDRYEVIIVDNGSHDGTPAVVATYPVTLLCETGARSPYAARNRGLAEASGAIIALTDGDCVADPRWLEHGARALDALGVDLVGGRVAFSFSGSPSASELFDSIANLEMKNNIRLRGVAKTGNLFFRRAVLDTVGPFPAALRSGGDVLWTGRATRSGLRMAYSHDAVVVKAARGFLPLLKKQFRVGGGQPLLWRDQGMSRTRVVLTTLRGFRPPSARSIQHRIRERGTGEMNSRLHRLWAVGWALRVAQGFGRVRCILWGRGWHSMSSDASEPSPHALPARTPDTT